jgi:hypothetical protein
VEAILGGAEPSKSELEALARAALGAFEDKLIAVIKAHDALRDEMPQAA